MKNTETLAKDWTIRTRNISSGEYLEAMFYEMSEADANHHALGDNPGSEVVGAWPYALHEIDEDADRIAELRGRTAVSVKEDIRIDNAIAAIQAIRKAAGIATPECNPTAATTISSKEVPILLEDLELYHSTTTTAKGGAA